jgi:hypothetical protein
VHRQPVHLQPPVPSPPQQTSSLTFLAHQGPTASAWQPSPPAETRTITSYTAPVQPSHASHHQQGSGFGSYQQQGY